MTDLGYTLEELTNPNLVQIIWTIALHKSSFFELSLALAAVASLEFTNSIKEETLLSESYPVVITIVLN
jgi:hypothetical protein